MGQAFQLFNNVWGVFDQSGKSVMDIDTITAMRYTNKSRVSDFPVEDGAFTTYNKVSTPFKMQVKIAVGGSRQRISNFITKLETLKNDTVNLYHFVTPEMTYLNCTVEEISYSRENAKGQDLVVALVDLLEVRVVTPSYTTTKVALPASKLKKIDMATMSCHGKQQPQPPPTPNYSTMTLDQLKALARQNALH